jgi:hypothetical protein
LHAVSFFPVFLVARFLFFFNSFFSCSISIKIYLTQILLVDLIRFLFTKIWFVEIHISLDLWFLYSKVLLILIIWFSWLYKICLPQ